MCGIFAVLSTARGSVTPTDALFKSRLASRGPDHYGSHHQTLNETGHDPLVLGLTSSVLALRGSGVVEQPLVHDGGEAVLCWNGEAWRIGGQPVTTNDGKELLNAMVASVDHQDPSGSVRDTLRLIDGPFAFVYFDKRQGRLYFGRDRLGRRSLLIHRSAHALQLSSIAGEPHQGWEEVQADGFYSLEIKSTFDETLASLTRHAWTENDDLVSSIGKFNAECSSTVVAGGLNQASPSVQQLQEHLLASLRPRVLSVPVPPACGPRDARLAVLFSGGLDCTILARLIHDLLPSDQAVDLINVAFENPRIRAQMTTKDPSCSDVCELCPDRLTGRKSFAELVKTCPSRAWSFNAVNVPYEETLAHRADVVSLIYPHQTEMDLSIANALYFASRGQGCAQTSPDTEPVPHQTQARVLISGLGADELFGGYTRHITAFNRGGHAGLADELKLDVSRLGKRNLGRDDRVLSHWGREVRFPFLDEALVRWAVELPMWEKCDFENPETEYTPEPAKRVLRLLAQNLGMAAVAKEKKRAIQFGARTAKMESGKVKGTTLITAP